MTRIDHLPENLVKLAKHIEATNEGYYALADALTDLGWFPAAVKRCLLPGGGCYEDRLSYFVKNVKYASCSFVSALAAGNLDHCKKWERDFAEWELEYDVTWRDEK